MATVSAWDLGYISTTQCLTRLERTFESLRKLPRYRGHLFNWYDTQTLVPLAPLYVSTVDSGNLLGYLLTLKTALPTMVEEMPALDDRFQEGLTDTHRLVRTRRDSRCWRGQAVTRRVHSAAIFDGFAPDWTCRPPIPRRSVRWLQKMSDEIAVLAARLHDAQDRMPSRHAAADIRGMVARCGRVDGDGTKTGARRLIDAPQNTMAAFSRTAANIIAISDELIAGTELDFLFDRQRHLFAIGYNVTEGRRDSTYYDALASEARLASFIAIAMRHVSQEHWFKLGRMMTPVGHQRALVSWSASMFEYLMPLLIMRTYPRTLLDETYEAVITRHIEYANGLGVPWGISESAYNVQDAAGNYQYRAFGVPGIGLKRGLADDLVVAPYACLLAAPLRPKEVLENLEHLAVGGCARSAGLLRGDRLHRRSPRARPAARRRQDLHGTPPGHEPGRAEQLPERQCDAGALSRRPARAGGRAAAAGTKPASPAARSAARGAQSRGDAGPCRSDVRAAIRHAAHRSPRARICCRTVR